MTWVSGPTWCALCCLCLGFSQSTSPASFFIHVPIQGYMLHLDPSATVDDVKAEIRQRLDVPPGQQRLIFRGQPLEDSKTLLENEITDGACIFLEE